MSIKKLALIFISILLGEGVSNAQNPGDSLVLFSDLSYHSEFEKKAIYDFVKERKDSFNIFLAIDPTMNNEEASINLDTYLRTYDQLDLKKLNEKSINKKIRATYANIHSRFLRKYNENEYFQVMFKNGNYNCVTASILYSLVFEKLKIPYKIMVASNHVYLVANPGTKSIVIETTNPVFAKTMFSGEYKQQYVNYLRNSKLINEDDYKNKSTEEIFEEKFNAVKPADFFNLPGLQYYNRALTKLENNERQEALELSKKAYFFYPDEKTRAILYNSLLFYIEKSDFDKVSDIDNLAILARFNNTETSLVSGIFNNIVSHYLQYTDKEAYCDSLMQRLTSQIKDKKTSDEIKFSYYLQMSYRFQHTNKVEYYVRNALKIKGNHSDANEILKYYIERKLNSIDNPKVMLDTLSKMESRYQFQEIIPLLKAYQLIGYLKTADNYFDNNSISNGDKYLIKFENSLTLPIENEQLSYWTERTYHTIAIYYLNKRNKAKAKSYVDRGLKRIPNSSLLKMTIR